MLPRAQLPRLNGPCRSREKPLTGGEGGGHKHRECQGGLAGAGSARNVPSGLQRNAVLSEDSEGCLAPKELSGGPSHSTPLPGRGVQGGKPSLRKGRGAF